MVVLAEGSEDQLGHHVCYRRDVEVRDPKQPHQDVRHDCRLLDLLHRRLHRKKDLGESPEGWWRVPTRKY